MTKAKRQPIADAAVKPDPGARDVAAIAYAKGRIAERRNRVAVNVDGEGSALAFSCPHSDADGHYRHLLDTFGTTSPDFINVAISQMLEAMRGRGKAAPGQAEINAALAFISGIEPANEVEAALAAQMAVTNGMALELLGRTRREEYVTQLEASGGLAVKLLRTFTLQAETLAKLRRGGGQTVRVEHVHVHAGGQAIVGNVSPGGGASLKSEDQPHAKQDSVQPALAHADAPFDPLRSANPQSEPLPVASDA
jgi:hypothetical protein